jgi:SAM-dependent methyltransferase
VQRYSRNIFLLYTTRIESCEAANQKGGVMLPRGQISANRILRAPAVLKQFRSFWRGYKTWRFLREWPGPEGQAEPREAPNPLKAFFEARKEGPGIWKWNHYFDIYHRHLCRFRGREVRVLEIGIYSGGSLDMWSDYFGASCQIFGVDIEPSCKKYERENVRVFIGDQSNRNFWNEFKKEIAPLDIVIDDGGHLPEQQIVTLEELLPHIKPRGVYICEDIHGTLNPFASYVSGLSQNLHACERGQHNPDNERRLAFRTTPLQSALQSVHLYPFVTVIERTDRSIPELVAAKHGTQWQPFLK